MNRLTALTYIYMQTEEVFTLLLFTQVSCISLYNHSVAWQHIVCVCVLCVFTSLCLPSSIYLVSWGFLVLSVVAQGGGGPYEADDHFAWMNCDVLFTEAECIVGFDMEAASWSHFCKPCQRDQAVVKHCLWALFMECAICDRDRFPSFHPRWHAALIWSEEKDVLENSLTALQDSDTYLLSQNLSLNQKHRVQFSLTVLKQQRSNRGGKYVITW